MGNKVIYQKNYFFKIRQLFEAKQEGELFEELEIKMGYL